MMISGFVKVGIKSLLLADEGDTNDVLICRHNDDEVYVEVDSNS